MFALARGHGGMKKGFAVQQVLSELQVVVAARSAADVQTLSRSE